jgi:hypothetical protein
MTDPRGTGDRIDWFLSHTPDIDNDGDYDSGACANHSWKSLGGDKGNPPAWNCPDANAVYDKVKASGRYWTGTPKRGGLVLWRYGDNGHAAIAYDDAGTKIATTNPSSGYTGVEPISYPAKWGAKDSARIWTDQYNGVRFEVGSGVGHGDVFLTKLVYGQEDSDSVRRLQEHLNDHPLNGGKTISTTGNYFEQTDTEARLCQKQHGFGSDPQFGSSVGPMQAEHLFKGCACVVVDDREPVELPPTPPEEGGDTIVGFGLTKWYSKKRDTKIAVHPDGDWHNVDLPKMAPTGITEESSEIKFLYLRIQLPANRTATRTIETRWVRSDGDETAYRGPAWDKDAKDSIPYDNVHLEDGSGLGGHWQIKVTGGTDPISYTTRYAKTHIYYEDAGERAS